MSIGFVPTGFSSIETKQIPGNEVDNPESSAEAQLADNLDGGDSIADMLGEDAAPLFKNVDKRTSLLDKHKATISGLSEMGVDEKLATNYAYMPQVVQASIQKMLAGKSTPADISAALYGAEVQQFKAKTADNIKNAASSVKTGMANAAINSVNTTVDGARYVGGKAAEGFNATVDGVKYMGDQTAEAAKNVAVVAATGVAMTAMATAEAAKYVGGKATEGFNATVDGVKYMGDQTAEVAKIAAVAAAETAKYLGNQAAEGLIKAEENLREKVDNVSMKISLKKQEAKMAILNRKKSFFGRLKNLTATAMSKVSTMSTNVDSKALEASEAQQAALKKVQKTATISKNKFGEYLDNNPLNKIDTRTSLLDQHGDTIASLGELGVDEKLATNYAYMPQVVQASIQKMLARKSTAEDISAALYGAEVQQFKVKTADNIKNAANSVKTGVVNAAVGVRNTAIGTLDQATTGMKEGVDDIRNTLDSSKKDLKNSVMQKKSRWYGRLKNFVGRVADSASNASLNADIQVQERKREQDAKNKIKTAKTAKNFFRGLFGRKKR